MHPGGVQAQAVRGPDQWQPVRVGLQMIFFAWLVNACSGLLHGLSFTALIESARHGGGNETIWKLLDRVGTFSAFTDIAATLVVALGIFLVARAPAQTGAGGLATGAFACALGSVALALFGFFEQVLMSVKAIRDPLLPWKTARYVYTLEAALIIVAVILFVVAALRIGAALRAPDAAWKGLVAVIAIPLVVLMTASAMFVESLMRLRIDHRWGWFLVMRGVRGLGDVMLLLFVAHLARRLRS